MYLTNCSYKCDREKFKGVFMDGVTVNYSNECD